MKKLNYIKNTKGITLIALIVTIMVIFIISGVVMWQVFSENGILNRIVLSKEKYNENQTKYALEVDLKKYSMKKI